VAASKPIVVLKLLPSQAKVTTRRRTEQRACARVYQKKQRPRIETEDVCETRDDLF
jgi:hypothetical protein